MKKFITLSLGLLAVVATLSAQDNSPSQPGGQGSDGSSWKQHGKKHGPVPGAKLTPDEQQRLQAAREKAKNDPTVRSLKEANDALGNQLEAAMRAAMLAADSSLAPVLDKIEEARDRAKKMRGNFESLTPEQKQQLKAARSAAKDDPAVQAAREKIRTAQEPEAKRAAAKEMHEAVKSAMLKADPNLGPLLEKLGPGAMGPGGPHHDRGPQGGGPGGPSPWMEGPPDDSGL
jgi:membrane protein involved in colicin uptake